MFNYFVGKDFSEVINAAYDCKIDKKYTREAIRIAYEYCFCSDEAKSILGMMLDAGNYKVTRDTEPLIGDREALAQIARGYAVAVCNVDTYDDLDVIAISVGEVTTKDFNDYWMWRKTATCKGIIARDFKNESQVSFLKDIVGINGLVPFLSEREAHEVLECVYESPHVRYAINELIDENGHHHYVLYHAVLRNRNGENIVIGIPATECGFDPLNSIRHLLNEMDAR